jgi:hypothetical protein
MTAQRRRTLDILKAEFMRQIETTPARPFYSVGYQYERNPWTVYSCNEFWRVLAGKKGTEETMPGTDSETTARRLAEWCVTQPGIKYAWVHVTRDCYNHKEVCRIEKPVTL